MMSWSEWAGILTDIQARNTDQIYFIASSTIMLIIVLVLYKTYTASRNVEKKLTELSSISGDIFSRKLQFIEINANEYQLNKSALGPLARIIDEYAVITTNNSGIITYANEKFIRLSGYAANELVGQPQSMNDSGVHEKKYWDELRSTILGGKVWHGEICNRSKSGDLYWMDTFIFPLSYITDVAEGHICFSSDITAIKKQNSQLMDENKRKDEFIVRVEDMLLHSEKMASLGIISAGVAHEINNPIAFVASNISTMKNYCKTLHDFFYGLNIDMLPEALRGNHLLEVKGIIDDCHDLVDETADGIKRIQRIVGDLKSFSHEQQDRLAPVSIHKCIDLALNLSRNETKYRINIRKNFGNDIPEILGSETKISQVFLNLVVNASHAIEDKGEIEIFTKKTDDLIIVQVSDNGKGIEPTIIKNIFEPFFTTKDVGQGTGLGLSISRDIIKRHGGKISVNSQPGAGTSFVIEFPIPTKDSETRVIH
ncbi:MAG TPA: ATP-binding protein [Pseudomonadales bacterium]|nr:ATP-binding protein [Pseudomonadales bacterium]